MVPSASDRRDPSSPQQPPHPIVQVFLSRPAYRLGTSVVGNVRVSWPEAADTLTDHVVDGTTSLRDALSSLQLYAAGRCRIDPRWHQVANYVKLYGATHPNLNPRIEQRAIHQSLQLGQSPLPSSSSSSKSPLERSSSMGTSVTEMEAAAITSSVVCFWATNVVELLELPERTVGAWDKVKPHPIKLHGVGQQSHLSKQPENDHDDLLVSSATSSASRPGHVEKHSQQLQPLHLDFADEVTIETTTTSRPATAISKRKEQLLFTFRIDLPEDIPPTFTAASCRYFYSVVVCAKVKSASGRYEDILVHVPLTVILTSSSVMSSPMGTLASMTVEDPTRRRSHNERVKVGSCVAMAHSVGLPCHLSATEIQHRHAGLMTVRRSQHYSNAQISSTSATSAAANNIPTLRVADPNGNPCCILTVIGDTMKWIPGSRIILQLDFPNPRSDRQSSRRRKNNKNYDEEEEQEQPNALVWIPCYQASACLTGEEVAVYEDGSKKRTRLYSLDTSHEMIDPQTTHRVCLTLFLPLDCPCTVQTDLVEISVQCRVDITVGTAATATSNAPIYTNLRLDLPCRVVQGDDNGGDRDGEGYSTHDDEDRNVNTMPLNELLFGHGTADHDNSENASSDLHWLEKRDILKDLKVLSLQALDYFST